MNEQAHLEAEQNIFLRGGPCARLSFLMPADLTGQATWFRDVNRSARHWGECVRVSFFLCDCKFNSGLLACEHFLNVSNTCMLH